MRVGAVTGVVVLSAGLGLELAPGTANTLSAIAEVVSAAGVGISFPAGSRRGRGGDTDTAYVSVFAADDETGSDVVVIDLAADSVVATIADTVGEGSSIAVDEDIDTAYTDGIDDSVAVIDGASNKVTATVSLGQLARDTSGMASWSIPARAWSTSVPGGSPLS